MQMLTLPHGNGVHNVALEIAHQQAMINGASLLPSRMRGKEDITAIPSDRFALPQLNDQLRFTMSNQIVKFTPAEASRFSYALSVLLSCVRHRLAAVQAS